MANGLSDIATLQAVPTRTGQVDGRKLQAPVAQAVFRVTLLGTESANEWHTLGRIQAAGYQVIPELCRIRTVSGTYSLVSKLQRVNAGGTASDVSAGVTHTQATSPPPPMVAAALTPPAVLNDTDTLRLTFTTVTTTNAGASFEVEVGYRVVG